MYAKDGADVFLLGKESPNVEGAFKSSDLKAFFIEKPLLYCQTKY